MVRYHDREWGVSVRGDRRLFELLTLEGTQAGLSWAIILRKRDGYRRAFTGFEPTCVARALSRDLVRRGFRFAGPTICYAFMQAAGLVDDHLVGCFRHRAGRSRA